MSWLLLATYAMCLMLLLRAYRSGNWPLFGVAVWTVVVGTAVSGLSPYTTAHSLRVLPLAVAGAAALLVTWAWCRGGSGLAIAPIEATKASYSMLMVVLLTIGAGSVSYAYRDTGLPLLQSDVDAVRAAAKPGLVVGLLRESVTVGAWLNVAVLQGAIRIRATSRWVGLAWLAPLLLLAAVGGSRNSLLFALAPALFGLRQHIAPLGKEAATRRIGVLVVVAAASFVLLLNVAGMRILAGEGVLERDIGARAGGSKIVAGGLVTMTNLAAPIETLGRTSTYVQDTRDYGQGRYTTYSLGTFYGPWIERRYVYDVTGPLSRPYYQNVGTFLAAPVLDGGPALALAVAALTGGVVGFSERLARRRGTLGAALLAGYVIYVGIFSVYEGLPFIYGAYLSIVPLVLASQRYLVWSAARGPAGRAPNRADRNRSGSSTDGGVKAAGALSRLFELEGKATLRSEEPHRGRTGDLDYGARRTLHTGIDLLTDTQHARLSARFERDRHVQSRRPGGSTSA